MTVFGFSVPAVSRLALRALLPLTLLMVGAIGTGAGSYSFSLRPAAERLARAEAAHQAAKQEQGKQQAARKMQEQMRRAQQELEVVWRVLPAQTQFTSLAVAISELGRSERVSIPGMTHSLEKQAGDLPVKATLTFRATGEYAAIYRFIHRLETSEPYLVIESLDAARATKSDRAGPTLVMLNVRVATFLRPAPLTTEMS